jgi:hypothetical protein
LRFLVRTLESARDFGIGVARWTTRVPAVVVRGGQRRTLGVFLLILGIF